MRKFLILAAAGSIGLSACTASGTAERNAVYGAGAGAATGAAAGAIISGQPGKGAAVGAIIGAIAGAGIGCAQAKDCFGRARDGGDKRYDSYAQRNYYVDKQTGDTYWEDGTFRSYGPGRGR
jgi:hypothetical protein